MDERVQIFISSHKPCERAESGFVRTVMQADVIRDLEGGDEKDRFMAAHANEFCELLTQYWAWKRCGAPSCIGCGCCSYVCPAKRYLAQSVKLAKKIIKERGI